MIRAKITDKEADDVWGEASAAQQQLRTETEQVLVSMLRMSVVKDWDHLKELIQNL
jgi:hypothetical protein